MNLGQRPVTFRATGDARYPYEAVVDGELWRVRVNEFPADPTPYTVFMGDEVVVELMEWPDGWYRPTADDDAVERAEYEREGAQFERTRAIRPSTLVDRDDDDS